MPEAVGQIVLEIVCGISGHFVLSALTFGGWKPLTGRDDVATLVGILFWAAVGVGCGVALG